MLLNKQCSVHFPSKYKNMTWYKLQLYIQLYSDMNKRYIIWNRCVTPLYLIRSILIATLITNVIIHMTLDPLLQCCT